MLVAKSGKNPLQKLGKVMELCQSMVVGTKIRMQFQSLDYVTSVDLWSDIIAMEYPS